MILFCCCSTAFVMLGAFMENDKNAFGSSTMETEKVFEDGDNEASTSAQNVNKDCITDPTGAEICPEPTTLPQPTQVKPTPTLSKQAFEVVCFDGKVEDAPEYTPDIGTKEPHSAIAFYIRPGENNASGSGRVFPDEYEEIEIVACLKRINERLQISCDYKASGKIFSQKHYHATYEMSVFEAHTGAQLGKHIVEAKSNWKCSTALQWVLSTEDTKSYAKPSDSELETLLQPYINP